MLTIHVWPKWLKEFLLTHPLYKSPTIQDFSIAFGDFATWHPFPIRKH